MKAARATIGRAVDQPEHGARFYLFHGPDEAQSRALGERLLKALGASKFIVSGGAIRSDPALLADEAGAMSLFGGPRLIWIEPAGEEITAGVEALLAADAVESPVVAIGGALRKTSALLKLAEAHRSALAHASYVPEGKDAERMVVEVGRTFGLRMSTAVAARIAAAAQNDQAIAARELEKFATYLGASPSGPKELDDDIVDTLGADLSESDVLRLGDLALAGNLAALAEALSRLSASGSEAIPAIRSLQRRLLMLAPTRARVDSGESVDAVMTSLGKSLFWKDKALIATLLARWDSPRLAKVAERASRLERDLMLTQAPAAEALGEELIAIGRAARRR